MNKNKNKKLSSEIICDKCKQNVINYVKCINCDCVYHPKCAAAYKHFKIINKEEIECCNPKFTISQMEETTENNETITMQVTDLKQLIKDTTKIVVGKLIKDTMNEINEYFDNQLTIINNKLDSLDQKFNNQTRQNETNTIKNKLDDVKNLLTKNTKDDRQVNKQVSYASVASNKKVVVIKPNDKQESNETTEFIKGKINPSQLKIGISEIKPIKEGGVIIKCNTQSEVEKIVNAANQDKDMHEKYKIECPRLKNPCIKIVDIETEMDEAELISNLINQNDLNEDVKMKVIVQKKMKKKSMAIIQCDPKSYEKIIENGKVFLNWTSCRVFDYVNIHRCFRCGGFNHNSSKCSEKEICLICAEPGHKTRDCQKGEKRCVNCLEANNIKKLNLDINHSCFDPCCSILSKKIEYEKQKIHCNPGSI